MTVCPRGKRGVGARGGLGPRRFEVPPGVRAAAARGLAWWHASDAAYRARTEVGRARAEQLASGSAITECDARVMSGWFARHSGDVRGVPLDPNAPTNGWKSIYLWGGPGARAWVDRIVASATRPSR